MASHNMPQLSLIAQYDDMCRHTKILTEGCEKDFKRFVESQKQLLRKRKKTEAELESLRKEVSKFKYEKQRCETQLEYMKANYVSEVERRKKLEQEKASLERQIALIKEVLLTNGNTMDNQTKEKLFQLSSTYKYQGGSPSKLTTIEESVGSLLSPSECDESEEDIDIGITQRKRRSKGKKSFVDQKRRKSEEKTDRLSLDNAFRLDVNAAIVKNGVKFSSNSDPSSTSPETATPRPVHRSDSENIKESTWDIRKSNTLDYKRSTPAGRRSIGGKIRTHDFAAKTIIKTEKCFPCGRPIKYLKQVLKCSYCRVTCHPECKDNCPEQCIPATSTPTKGFTGTIGDYTPSTPPMVPPIIMYCVNKIETSGLKEQGLYRIPGSEREVKDLKEKFLKGKTPPSLNNVDINAVCGTIKEFLRSLKDTLITRVAWQTFVDAASNYEENLSMNMLFSAVCDLPQPNRDTLAFLILHLQRVASSPECRMPVQNLAKVFGPTIVGYSSEPVGTNVLTETKQQCMVMEKLLLIPADSWQNLLNVESDIFCTPMKTPECTPAPVTSRLGPILASGQTYKNTPILKTHLKPRTPKSTSKMGRRNIFSSPALK